MKPVKTAPESAPERGREMSSKDEQTQVDDDSSNAALPHEADQSVDSQDEHEPREVGKQAHDDVKRGLVDTDRRGGGAYQEATQRDDHANENSGGGSGGRGAN
ncbi:hypothetical protein [Caballeronia sp. TF1N1]|jgi:hypothetical protein|uniref:hypothetical protein n=2 Tax=Caballeronia TaxID=1827195 RepID=UPI00351D0865